MGIIDTAKKKKKIEMPFKIVKTIERGKEKLSIIPSAWEKDGWLRWPTKKFGSKLNKLEYSKPHTDWTKMQCMVKRSSIATYNNAEKELSVMLNHSDTSDYPDAGEINKLDDIIDYNAMAASLAVQQQQKRVEEDVTSENLVVENNILCQDSMQESATTSANNVIEILSSGSYLELNKYSQLLENQNQILNNQKTIMDNQNIIHEKQKQIIEKEEKNSRQMSDLIVLIDDSFTRLRNQNLPTVKLGEASSMDLEAFMIKPVSNAEEFNKLENTLFDKTEKQKLHLKYSLLCSKSEGSGINCAYKMLDIIFAREFLCQCSWSGGSKGQTVKIAFKGYRNILNLFFCLIRNWDSSYTNEQNEQFFKTVLKNSGKRLEMKNLRASTKRNRGNSRRNNKLQTITTAIITEKGEKTSKVKETEKEMDVIENEIGEEIYLIPSTDFEKDKELEHFDEEESLC